jgi:5-methylcytosine-specific restriction endonuclease McrA
MVMTISSSGSLFKRYGNILIERDGFYCHYCGVSLEENDPFTFTPRGASVDHIIPQKEGGNDNLPNLVLACRRCNGEKKTKHYHEFKLAKEIDLILMFLMGGDAS